MEEKKKSLTLVSFKCSKCDKPILGHKCIRISGKRFHMTCGLMVAKEKMLIKA